MKITVFLPKKRIYELFDTEIPLAYEGHKLCMLLRRLMQNPNIYNIINAAQKNIGRIDFFDEISAEAAVILDFDGAFCYNKIQLLNK